MENNAKLLVNEKCALKSCDKDHCRMLWHKPCAFYKPVLVAKLWPMLVLVGSSEVAVGFILLAVILSNSQEFDKIYSTGNNRGISSSIFLILVSLTVTGLLLLTSLMLERRRLMLIYILLSITLCCYIFTLSTYEIHIGILRLRKDAYKTINKIKLLNTPCILGIITMLGSVVHFIGNLIVITYYNFKFIQPRLNTYELSNNS